MPPKLAGLERALAARVAAHNDDSILKLCAWVGAEHGVVVSHGALHKALARLGLTRKKRRCTPPSNVAPT